MIRSQDPRVSIVLPTFNQVQWLRETLDSVFCQTWSDFELIVVNDGSTDGSEEVLNSLDDPRVRVIHQSNTRLPRALNRGMVEARGEYVTWISSDNVCAPFFLEALVMALDGTPEASLAVANFAWINENGVITRITRSQDLSPASFLTRNPSVAAFMYRRSAHDRVGFYDPTLEGAEDWEMWQRIIETGPAVHVPTVLYYYREHGRSMSSTLSEKVRRASSDTFVRAIVKRGAEFSVREFYPAISRCVDQDHAAAGACADLAVRVLRSPFGDAGFAVKLLEAAAEKVSGASLQTNRVLALARAGRYDQARQFATTFTNPAGKQEKLLRVVLSQATEPGTAALIDQVMPQVVDELTGELRSREIRIQAPFSGSRSLPAEARGPHRALSFGIISNGRKPELLAQVVASIRMQNIPHAEIVVAGRVPAMVGVVSIDAFEAADRGHLGEMRNLVTTRSRFPHVVILDDDMLLTPGWYEVMRTRLETDDIVTSSVSVPDGGRYWDHAEIGGPNGHRLLLACESSDHLYMSGGVAWVMSRRVASQVTWDEQRAFYQQEDVDFSARCRAAGFRITHEPAARVIHADATYTQLGRQVLRRKHRMDGSWVLDYEGATQDEILGTLRTLVDEDHAAEVWDLLRFGAAKFSSSSDLLRWRAALESRADGHLPGSVFYPRGDPIYFATLKSLAPYLPAFSSSKSSQGHAGEISRTRSPDSRTAADTQDTLQLTSR